MIDKLSKKQRLGLFLLISFLLMQFLRIDKRVPTVDPNGTFVAMYEDKANESTLMLLKEACYDCHSYQTVYPGYAEVAPISLWLKGHVDNGRDALNFDLWNSYSASRQKTIAEESVEAIETKWMPLLSYSMMHPKAKLSDEQRVELVNFFNGI